VGGPTAVWEPAAHTKESAGERSLPISLIYPRQLGEQGTSEYHYTSTTSTSDSWPSVVEKRIFGHCQFVELIRTCELPAAYPRSRNFFMARSQMLWSLVKHIGQNRVQ
jgi:hypothetical protein